MSILTMFFRAIKGFETCRGIGLQVVPHFFANCIS